MGAPGPPASGALRRRSLPLGAAVPPQKLGMGLGACTRALEGSFAGPQVDVGFIQCLCCTGGAKPQIPTELDTDPRLADSSMGAESMV